MRLRCILIAAAVGVAALAPATADAATLRVVSGKRTLLSVTQVNVGSARSYLDMRGRSHRLRARTALGQLVAANAFFNTWLRVAYMSGLGAYVTTIAGVPAPTGGYWALFVNGDMAMVGADSLIVGRDDSVMWIADDDYKSANGPWAYVLTAAQNADGTTTLTGRKVGGATAVPAKGATLIINGSPQGALDARGRVTLALHDAWTARLAAGRRTAASLTIAGVGPSCRARTTASARVC